MVKVLRILGFLAAVTLGSGAQAYTYNSNYTTTVTGIATYTASGEILISVASLPTDTACTGPFFVIAADVPTERKQIVLSRLALAYANKEPVIIGYDKVTCYTGSTWIWVARVG